MFTRKDPLFLTGASEWSGAAAKAIKGGKDGWEISALGPIDLGSV